MPEIEGIVDLVAIGRGGFGTVFRGHQADIGRVVAIKVLTGQPHDDEADHRFRREVTAMGAISHHPNVVPVYATGVAGDGRPFLVMPYLPGGTLGDRLGTLTWRQMVDLGSKMSGALQAAHDVGVLHRDVKPANILWSAWDEPQLADFGIARLHDATRTAPGQVVASLTWAAPEVLEGKPASPASDVYSLAASLHAAITGRSPHAPGPDEPMATTVARIASEPAPDLTRFGVPSAVSDVIAAALAKDPARRPARARAFGDALVAAATAQPEAGPPPAPVPAVQPLTEPELTVPPASAPEAWAALPAVEPLTQPEPPVHPASAPKAWAALPAVEPPAEPEPSVPLASAPLTPAAMPAVDPARRVDHFLPPDPGSARRRRHARRRVPSAALVGAALVVVLLGLFALQALLNRDSTKGSASDRTTSTSPLPSTTAPSRSPTTGASSSGSVSGSGSGGGRSGGSGSGGGSGSPSTSSAGTSSGSASGSSKASTTTTTTPTTAPTTTAGASAASSAAPTQVTEALASYYDLVGRGDYATTWARLTSSYQSRIGGYGAYTAFWRSYDRVTLSGIRDHGDLTATATLRYHQTNGATVQETGRFQFVRRPTGELAISDYRASTRSR